MRRRTLKNAVCDISTTSDKTETKTLLVDEEKGTLQTCSVRLNPLQSSAMYQRFCNSPEDVDKNSRRPVSVTSNAGVMQFYSLKTKYSATRKKRLSSYLKNTASWPYINTCGRNDRNAATEKLCQRSHSNCSLKDRSHPLSASYLSCPDDYLKCVHGISLGKWGKVPNYLTTNVNVNAPISVLELQGDLHAGRNFCSLLELFLFSILNRPPTCRQRSKQVLRTTENVKPLGMLTSIMDRIITSGAYVECYSGSSGTRGFSISLVYQLYKAATAQLLEQTELPGTLSHQQFDAHCFLRRLLQSGLCLPSNFFQLCNASECRTEETTEPLSRFLLALAQWRVESDPQEKVPLPYRAHLALLLNLVYAGAEKLPDLPSWCGLGDPVGKLATKYYRLFELLINRGRSRLFLRARGLVRRMLPKRFFREIVRDKLDSANSLLKTLQEQCLRMREDELDAFRKCLELIDQLPDILRRRLMFLEVGDLSFEINFILNSHVLV
ncbi:hypothetical protein AAHC03_05715 [Spirometra sp. Aus1]